jgi:hypothetical protein
VIFYCCSAICDVLLAAARESSEKHQSLDSSEGRQSLASILLFHSIALKELLDLSNSRFPLDLSYFCFDSNYGEIVLFKLLDNVLPQPLNSDIKILHK